MLFAIERPEKILLQVRVEDGRGDPRADVQTVQRKRRSAATVRCSDVRPRDTPQAAGACGACERTIDPAPCVRRLVVARKAHLRTILTSIAAAVLISVHGELIRRSPHEQALFTASSPPLALQLGATSQLPRTISSTHAFLSGKRR